MQASTGADKFRDKISQKVEKTLPTTEADLKKIGKEKLAKRASLKKKLKEAFTTGRTKDLAITETEQQDIYQYVKSHIPSTLAQKYNITNAKQLMKFIGLSTVKEQANYEKYKDMLKNSPNAFCSNFDKFKTEPWAKEMILKLIPKHANFLLNQGHELIDMAWAEEVYNLAMPYNPEGIYRVCARARKTQPPMFKRLLFSAADLSPGLPLSWVSSYKRMPYAKELFLKGIAISKYKGDCACVTDYMKNYYDMPWAKDVVKKYLTHFANKEDADYFFLNTVGHDAANMPWMQNAYLTIAPFVTEKYVKKEYSKFKDQPWAEEFLLKCFKSQDKVDKFLNNNQPRSDFLELLEEIKQDPTNMEKQESLSKLATLEPAIVFKNINKLKSLMVTPGELLVSAALTNPKLAFTYLPNYINEPFAKDVLLTAVKIKPEFAYYYSSIIKDLPNNGGKDVLLTAMKTKKTVHKMAVIYFKNYQDAPWASEILDNCRSLSLIYTEYFDSLPSKKVLEVLMKVAKKAPLHYLLNYNAYLKNIPGAPKLFDVALNNQKFYSEENHRMLLSVLKEPTTRKKYLDAFKEFEKKKQEVSKYDEILNVILSQNIKSSSPEGAEGPEGAEITKLKMKFLNDPALKLAIEVKPEWLDPKPKNNFSLQQFRVMVARNIYIENKSVKTLTKKLVQKSYKSILERREKMKNQKLFKDRHVLYISGNEKTESKKEEEKYRFGKPSVFSGIKAQKSKSLTSFRAENNKKEECERVKKLFLDKVVNVKPPLSIVFDAHGFSNGVSLSKGGVKISPTDIAKALSARYKKLQKTPALFAIERENPPIILYNSCFASTILRKVYSRMDKQSIQPIQIGIAEYDLNGYSDIGNKFGTRFTSHVMNLKKRGYITTIGTIVQNEQKGLTNSAVYIPTKWGTQEQIAEIQGPSDELHA